MLGILGVFLSLTLLMYLAYRGVDVIILAPAMALLAVLFNCGIPLFASYTQIFMTALGSFIVKYFPIFLLGAIFGRLLDDSGAAKVIALRIAEIVGRQRAILAVVLACGLLTYGGVSLFVVAFAVYPLAAAMFRQADIPKRLIPGAIALGSFTFTMTCLPGTIQIQNLIPMPYFKTTAFAAPGLGVLGGLLMFLLGMSWLHRRARRAALSGEGYGADHLNEPSPESDRKLPTFAVAVLPVLAVLVLNYVFAEHVMRRWDAGYLADAKYGSTDLDRVRGIWAILAALLISNALLAALTRRPVSQLNASLTKGSVGSLVPIFNTASVVGYGATIASLPAFAVIKEWLIGLSPGNSLVSEAVAVNVLAGITGSASGGLSIVMEILGDTYYRIALETGVSPEIMHRVASMSSGGLDSLPHNGAVITLLIVCGLTHRQSYLDIAVVSVAIPILATCAVVATGTVLGSF
jgi:H+/gluconate symporter-like permease